MKIVFWLCWLADIVILITFLSALLKTIESGVIASKSKAEIFQFISIIAGLAVSVVVSIILYNQCWIKTAALLASIPILVLFCILLIPIIAWISGARMN